MKLIKVIQARYIEDYIIEFTFSDGKIKSINFKGLLWGEVFEPLNDVEKFQKFSLNPFTIEWENGADFAPEFLYNYSGESELNLSKTTTPK